MNKKFKAQCRADAPNACTSEGVALREDAKTDGALSTIGVVSGGLLLASGVTLVATAPATSSGRDEPASARNFVPALQLSVRGVW